MNQFKPNQKVLCVNDSLVEPWLTKGREYTVKSVTCCSGCGILELQLKEIPDEKHTSECAICGCIEEDGYYHTFRASRFTPLQSKSAPMITYVKLLEEVPVLAN